MKLTDYGRKPQKGPKPKTEREVEAARRLEQALERLRASLGLGWRGQGKDSGKRDETLHWECADLSVQSQAAKAVLGYAECWVAEQKVVEKDQAWRQKLQVSLVEAIAALESLLASSSSAVRSKAAAAAALLAEHLGTQWGQLAPYHLLAPLAALLDDPDGQTVCSAARALDQTLSKVRVKDRSYTGFQGEHNSKQELAMWQSLIEVDPLRRIERQLSRDQPRASNGPEASGPIAAAILRALEALIERWPVAAQEVRRSTRWCHLAAHYCEIEEDEVAVAGFGCAAAIAGDPQCAQVLGQDCPQLWRALASQLQPARGTGVEEQALRLLAQLPGAPHFGAVLKDRDVKDVARGCVRALGRSPGTRGPRDPPPGRQLSSPDALKIQALRATCAFLRWPGQHHQTFLAAGLIGALLEVLGGKGTGDGKEGRQNPKLRRLAWQVLFWVGAFSTGTEGKDEEKKMAQLGKLPTLLSEAFLGVLHRRSSSLTTQPQPTENILLPGATATAPRPLGTESESSSVLLPAGHTVSPQEAVEICRAALAFVASRDPSVSARSQAALGEALKLQGRDWLPSLVRQVAVYRKAGAKVAKLTPADDQTRVSRLFGVAVLATDALSLEQLLEAGVVEVLMRTTQQRMVDIADEPASNGVYDEVALRGWSEPGNDSSSQACLAGWHNEAVSPSSSVEYFNRPVEDWEGKDPILFAALAALLEVLRNQPTCAHFFARPAAGPNGTTPVSRRSESSAKLSQEVALNGSALLSPSQDSEAIFLDLASEKFPSAIRWLGAQIQAIAWGLVGFPSAVGESMGTLLNDPTTADLTFLFATGQRLHVHRAVLASRSPTLLAAFSSRVGRPESSPSPSIPPAFNSDQVTLQPSQAVPGPGIANTMKLGKAPKSGYGEPIQLQASCSKTATLAANGKAPGGEPLEMQLSPRVSFKSFCALMEFVYTGSVRVAQEGRAEAVLLARKCGVKLLASLLQGQRPQWGCAPGPCNLSAALTGAGWALSDAVLYTSNQDLPAGSLAEPLCGVAAPHLHAHRAVLGARSEYLGALFRSGMRDSLSGQVLVPDISISAVGTLLHFLYSGHLSFSPIPQPCQQQTTPLPDLPSPSLPCEPPLENCLSMAIQLSSLSEQWMMEDLREACWEFVVSRLSPENGLHVLQEAAKWHQWVLVQAAVQCLAPAYAELRDRGLLEDLGEDLQEAVRLEQVKLRRRAVQ